MQCTSQVFECKAFLDIVSRFAPSDSKLTRSQSKNVVRDILAGIALARSQLEPMFDKKMFHEGARAKSFSVAAPIPEIVTGDTDLSNV
jgi:hypothetical protein